MCLIIYGYINCLGTSLLTRVSHSRLSTLCFVYTCRETITPQTSQGLSKKREKTDDPITKSVCQRSDNKKFLWCFDLKFLTLM